MRFRRIGLPWHNGLGTRVNDCATAKEVIEKADLDFKVAKCQLVARMPFSIDGCNETREDSEDFIRKGNIYRELDGAYATFRTDTNAPFGVVKSKYEVVQNSDAFDFFNDAIGEDKAQWEYAGYMGYGHKVFITAKLPIISNIGPNDPIHNFLVFSNSHDGTGSIDIMFTPIRVICTNCLSAGLNSAASHIRIRHTQTAKEKLERGAQILKIACEYSKKSEAIYQSLAVKIMDDNAVKAYIAKLICSEEEYNNIEQRGINTLNRIYYLDKPTMEDCNISTRKANTLRSIFETYLDGVGQNNILGTAWGAYNGITNYYSNVAFEEGEKRTETLLWGNAGRIITEALALAAA